MKRPSENEGKLSLPGFSILDDDFDLMAGDLCNNELAELAERRISESVKSLVNFVSVLWHGTARLKAA